MVTLGIPTYNRLNILKMMAESLAQSNIDILVNIRIYDDASTEYDEETLRSIFPQAVSITRHKENHGADYNMWYMYSDFLKTDDEYFFNCDSDLIFSKGWLDKGIELLKKTDGILSLFNAPSHSVIEKREDLCEKNDVGGAGTLFSRECVESIINEMRVESYHTFDWDWCVFLQNKGKRIFSVTNSLVQHIGIIGQNSLMASYDYGDGFIVDTIQNGQILNEVLRSIKIDSYLYPWKRWLALFPYSQVPVHSRIVIFGAGKAGTDFQRQMDLNHYCDVAAVIDMNKYDNKIVFSMDKLGKIDFEYIILASASDKIQDDMEKTIIERYPDLEGKLIKPDIKSIRMDSVKEV